MLSASRSIARRMMYTSANHMASMRVAIIGQSNFGAEVYKSLKEKGHKIVGVFTIPDIQVRAYFCSSFKFFS